MRRGLIFRMCVPKMLKQCCLVWFLIVTIVLVLFIVPICPVSCPTRGKTILGLAHINFITNFTLTCVNAKFLQLSFCRRFTLWPLGVFITLWSGSCFWIYQNSHIQCTTAAGYRSTLVVTSRVLYYRLFYYTLSACCAKWPAFCTQPWHWGPVLFFRVKIDQISKRCGPDDFLCVFNI